MAQITDVMDALAVFDAAHQELSWAYSGDFNDIPENLKSPAHKISEVLAEAGNECVRRFIFSHDNTDEEGDTRSTSEAESQSIRGMDWLMRLKKVAYDMRAVARQELLEDCKIEDKPVRAWWLRCLPRARITRCNPTIDIVAQNLEELRKQCVDFGYTATGLPLDTKQPFDGGQEETPVTTDVLVGRDDDKVVRNNDDKRSVSPQEWPGLRENLDIWNNNNFDSLVHRIMRRVCFWMESRPSLDAWFSFPYCAFVFPKRKGHGTHDLLNQWCSLGITTRQRGESCILELLGNWLLLLKKPASNASSMSDADGSNIKAGGALGLPTGEQSTIAKGQIGKEVRGEGERKEEVDEEEDTFLPFDESSFNENMGGNRIKILISSIPDVDVTMEDFTHDFARYLLGDRLIIVDGRNGATPQLSCVNKSAYLALVSNLNAEQSEISSILPPKILALRFEDCREMELSDGAFAFAKYLRLLDLSGCSVKKLPGSIRHLKQLRYLKAPGIQDEVFPRPITGLHELRYLNLQGSCPLSDLTEAFMRFGNLLHLDLSGCSGLKELPKSFGRLWMLEHLDLSRSGIETLPDSFGWLKSLTHLHLAGCSGLKALPESFKSLPILWHLNLSGCSGLKGLEELYSRSLPRELRHLDLSGCWGLKKLSTSSPPKKLQHLDLSGCSRLKAVVSYMPLIELQHLDLSGCSGLEEVGAGMLRPKLRHLNLSGCSVLKPSIAFDLERLMELMFLDMSGCLRLQVPEDLVLAIRGRGGKASGPNDAKLVIDPEITVMNKLRGHFPEFNQPRFCS